MPKEVEKSDLPKAVVRLTRSLRKRIESIDSDVSERSNTPHVFDLEVKNETSPINIEKSEKNKLDSAPMSKLTARAQSEIKSNEVMNSPMRRRGRRASSVTLEENSNQDENTKTPIKQEMSIAGRRITRRSSALLTDTGVLSPVVASPSRRGRRRSINLTEDVNDNKVHNPILPRKITLLDVCVPEEEDVNEIQFTKGCTISNSKSPNDKTFNGTNEEDKLSPAFCTRSRSNSPRDEHIQIENNQEKNQCVNNEKENVNIKLEKDNMYGENNLDVGNDQKLVNIGNVINETTENNQNKFNTEASQNMSQENTFHLENLKDKSIILENDINQDNEDKTEDIKMESIEVKDNEDFIQLQIDEDEDISKITSYVGKMNDEISDIVNDDDDDNNNEHDLENSIKTSMNDSKILSSNINKSKMNFSKEKSHKVVDEEMEKIEKLDKLNRTRDDVDKSRNSENDMLAQMCESSKRESTVSISKIKTNDNSINLKSYEIVVSSKEEIDENVKVTELNERVEGKNSSSDDDIPLKKYIESNNSLNQKSLLEKSKNVEDSGKKNKENLSTNVITISSNLISKYGAENSITPFRKRMSTELTASSTPIMTEKSINNENNSRTTTEKNMSKAHGNEEDDVNNEKESKVNCSVQDGSLVKRNISKKHQTVVINPIEINDKSSKFPKTPIPTKSRSRISDDFDFNEADDNFLEKLNDSVSNFKSNEPKTNSLINEKCTRSALNLSDNDSNTNVERSLSITKLSESANKDILHSNFAKSWNQSVKGNANTTIDAYGLKKNDTIEKQQNKKDENFTDANKSKFNTDESMGVINDEVEEEKLKEKNEFIDDEAEEIESYKSNDSMDSEEKEYLEQNEILDDGVSIGSEDTVENCINGGDSDEKDEDEMDSFIVSDTEDQRMFEGSSTDEYEFKSDTSEVDEDIREKFNKRKNKNKKKIISSDEEDENNENEKKEEEKNVCENNLTKLKNSIKTKISEDRNINISKDFEEIEISGEEDSKITHKDGKSNSRKSTSLIEINQFEKNIQVDENPTLISLAENNDKHEEKDYINDKVEELNVNEANNSKQTKVTVESENNLLKETIKLQNMDEEKEKEVEVNAENNSGTDTDEFNHDNISSLITKGTNKRDLYDENKEKIDLKKSKRHSFPPKGKYANIMRNYRDTKSLEKDVSTEKQKQTNIDQEMHVKETDVKALQQNKETLKDENSSNVEQKSFLNSLKTFPHSSNDKSDDSDDNSEKNEKNNDLEATILLEVGDKSREKMSQSLINIRSVEKSHFSNISKSLNDIKEIKTNNEKENESESIESDAVSISNENPYEHIVKKCNEMLEAASEAKKKEKILNKKNKVKKNKKKKNQNDSVESIEKEKENQIESPTECYDKEIKETLKFSTNLLKKQVEKEMKTFTKRSLSSGKQALKIQQYIFSKRLPDDVIKAVEKSQNVDDSGIVQKTAKKDAGTKHLKRKLSEESSSSEREYFERSESNKKKNKKLCGIIRNPSGIFFEESITPKKSKKDEVKLLKFSWGTVREEEITPLIISGFKETQITPIKSEKKKLKKMKDNEKSKLVQYSWGVVHEETINKSNIIPPKSISHKLKTILADEQKEPPRVEEGNKKLRAKRKILDPISVLPKPNWIKTLEEHKQNQQSSEFESESEIYDDGNVKKIRFDKLSTNNTMEFLVKPLKEKKQKIHKVGTICSSAFEFKKKSLFSDKIPRETSKQLLQKKEKQRYYTNY